MSTMAKQPAGGWQLNKSIIECNRYMLRNRISTDLCLEVGKPETKITLFFAHQYVLISRSPVFQALLSKVKQENTDSMPILRITDIPPKAIEAILKYIYCNDIAIDDHIVFDVLQGANKFGLASLITTCNEFLQSHLSVNKVCEYLEKVSDLSGQPFIMQCMYYIWSHADKVLKSKGFTNLSAEMLTAIVSSDYIAIPEKQILKACLGWAEKRCTDTNVVPTPDMLRRCLGDTIYDIRFPLMEPSEFANLVGHSDLLTNDEKSDIYTHMLASNGPRVQKSQFLSSPRTQKSVLNRFPVAMKRVPSEEQDDDGEADESIVFTADHDILLCGVGVYGAITTGRIHVHLQLIANGTDPISMASDLTVDCDGQPVPYELLMSAPVYLSKLQSYTVLVNITGGATYRGFRGNGDIPCDGVAFAFSKSELSDNDTAVESGQIPQLMFYKAPL